MQPGGYPQGTEVANVSYFVLPLSLDMGQIFDLRRLKTASVDKRPPE